MGHLALRLLLAGAALASIQVPDQHPGSNSTQEEPSKEVRPSWVELFDRSVATLPHLRPIERISPLEELCGTPRRLRVRMTPRCELQLFDALVESGFPGRAASQIRVVTEVAQDDPEEAFKLLLRMDPPKALAEGYSQDVRDLPAASVVSSWIKRDGKKASGRIRAAMDRLAESGAYPYQSLDSLLPQLNEIDPELASELVGDAVIHFAIDKGKYRRSSFYFAELLAENQTSIPRPLIQQGLDLLMDTSHPAARSTALFRYQVMTSAGAALFNGEEEMEDYQIFSILKKVDSDKASAFARSHPGIESALKVIENGTTLSTSISIGGDSNTASQNDWLSFQNIITSVRSNPGAARAAASNLGSPGERAIVLATAAASLKDGDRHDSDKLLADAVSQLDLVNDPENKLQDSVDLLRAWPDASRDARFSKLLHEQIEFALKLTADRIQHSELPSIGYVDNNAMLRSLFRMFLDEEPSKALDWASAQTNDQIRAYLLAIAAKGMIARSSPAKAP